MKPTHKAIQKKEETMSDADNKAVSNVTVAGQPLPLRMRRLNKEADRQTFDSHYKDKSQTCGREGIND